MPVYQDRCAELNFHPDVIGIYNEWTLASSMNFPLHGIILEQAESAVRMVVRQILNQIDGSGIQHISLPARFIKGNELRTLRIPDLTNQRLLDYQ